MAEVLGWRHSVIDLARERARQVGREGAAYPWGTIRGQEFSGYWPAGTAASHIDADLADATVRYRIAATPAHPTRPALSNATAPRSPLSGRIPGQGFGWSRSASASSRRPEMPSFS